MDRLEGIVVCFELCFKKKKIIIIFLSESNPKMFLERIILTWFFFNFNLRVCLSLVLQTNCVLNKNVTRCCRRTWRLPSRIFKTCNIPFSFTYNIVYYTVHIPTYKSWTTSHNLVMGRVSTWKFRCSFYLIIDPSLKNSNFEITELLYNTILKF